MFVDFRNSALYSPVVYLPQAAGLALGRLLRMPLLDAYYLGRLLNLIAPALLCYWTALRLPYGQLTFVMLALCPMFLFEQASFSADALTYALSAAFCGAVLRESVRTDTPLGRRAVIVLALLGALMGLTKPSAAPLPLLALWLVAVLFFDRKTFMIFAPGQMRVRQDIGSGEVAYDTEGMVVAKRRSDLFRHWLLGLGSGDLLVKTAGAN